ncbi:FecR family protein [Mucilaginibacter sp. BJC16-A38]|uniref:FecR family protein n=1 Tax=Mucilaginibacter phenanthrenivorans TaxID=1234842 RepID=UPI002157C203|nr:FecR family protein [Mucilaginibacter phenanthrenivorans]MCR8556991.1 FecR family protein [Mucilaginibacter phenanthrenivorans]
MDKDRTNYLYEQYRAGKLTGGELLEWEALLAGPTETLRELTEELWNRADDTPGMEHAGAMEVYEHIVSQPQVQRSKWRLWPRIAVAASVILALSSGVYFFLRKPSEQQSVSLVKNDIPPGHNQATLTLAGGKKIILTKGLSGKLAQQGQTVINASENNITYNAKNQSRDQVSYNTLSTAKGEQSPYPLVLADGTKVWLNAESSITFPTAFNGKERKVTLTGEAYFEVAHNSKHPFKVEANGQTIEDIGTSFDVNAYANEPTFKTTLVEGSIKINNITLIPGQQARNTNGTIKVISEVNTKVYTAWKDGYFRYELETLPEIMREFARWYKVDVVFATPPTDQQFNMKVSRKATLNRALQILANGGIRYKLEGNKLTITP